MSYYPSSTADTGGLTHARTLHYTVTGSMAHRCKCISKWSHWNLGENINHYFISTSFKLELTRNPCNNLQAIIYSTTRSKASQNESYPQVRLIQHNITRNSLEPYDLVSETAYVFLNKVNQNMDLHPSTSSTAVWAKVHLMASSELWVLSSLQTALLQRASRARWRESPFQPKT